MRISSSQIHANAVSAMLKQQAELAKTQTQISSGQRVTSPADDPIAMTRVLQLQQKQSANDQYESNSSAAKTRLSQEEQALADTDSLIQQVYELAVQANNSSLSSSDRSAISTQLTELKQQLLDIANQKDSNDEYLFSGFSTSTKPFAVDSSGSVDYSGAPASRSLQVSSSQYVSDSDAGDAAFMNIAAGNGVFVASASASNTGTGVLEADLLNRAAWVPDDYTLSFNAGNWTVTDGSGTTVSTGAYTEGQSIDFNGVQLTVTGTPADGDSFSIGSSGKEDLFSTLDNLISAVSGAQDTDADKASFQNQMNGLLTQLDQAETHVLSLRTSVGVRLSSLDTSDTARSYAQDSITTELSNLRDTDMVAAASKLAQQTVALQAAQASYAKIAQLSLFNYL